MPEQLDLLNRSPRKSELARCDERFGALLHRAVSGSLVTVKDVARLTGTQRRRLYEVFEGCKPFPAARLELLPPDIYRAVVEDGATRVLGMTLTPARDQSRDVDPATLAANVSRDLAAVIGRAHALADMRPTEARALLDQVERAEETLADLRARIEHAARPIRGVESSR